MHGHDTGQRAFLPRSRISVTVATATAIISECCQLIVLLTKLDQPTSAITPVVTISTPIGATASTATAIARTTRATTLRTSKATTASPATTGRPTATTNTARLTIETSARLDVAERKKISRIIVEMIDFSEKFSFRYGQMAAN